MIPSQLPDPTVLAALWPPDFLICCWRSAVSPQNLASWGVLRLRPDTHPPAPLQNIEEVRTTFGPNLAPLVPKICFSIWWEVKFLFLVCTLKMLRTLWGIQICMQNRNFSDPWPPPSSPRNLVAGTRNLRPLVSCMLKLGIWQGLLWGSKGECLPGARLARYLSINYPDFSPRFTL